MQYVSVYGIFLFQGSGLTVSGNTIKDSNDLGFRASGSVDITVADNVITGATSDGLDLVGVTGAVVARSDARDSGGLDCRDSSRGGTGTNGTDNTWTANLGLDMSPDGICTDLS